MPDGDGVAPDRTPKRPLSRILSIAGSFVGLLGLFFVIRVIASEWDQIERSIRDADLRLMGAAVVVGAGGMGWIGFQWANVVDAIGGGRVRVRSIMRSYFIGQMGKYVPGGVWPVMGRAELLTRSGTARAVAYPSVGLSMATTYLAAVILAAGAAPFVLWSGDRTRAWILLALPAGAAALHPAILRRVAALGERVFSRGSPVTVPPWRVTLLLVVRHVPAWVLISGATYLIGRSLGFDPGLAAIAFATPLAWAAGLAAVPVPGGIGVREAVFVGLTAGSIGRPEAAAIAVTARLIFIAADLLTAAIAATITAPSPEPR